MKLIGCFRVFNTGGSHPLVVSRAIRPAKLMNFRSDAFGISEMHEQIRLNRMPRDASLAPAEFEPPAAGGLPSIEASGGQRIRGTTSSLALNNLRGVVIVIVLAFHSSLAYLGWLGPSAFPFNRSPYEWRAFPIIDSHRWFGFDLFCAWQDVYLMSLMFFLSALFTWSSLTRKGTGRFLIDRFLRLGVPFGFALFVVMPLALYPVYRVTADDPGLASYAQHYLALPFWPDGPMWFLWQLLALTVAAACLHRYAPSVVTLIGRWSSSAGARPGRYFVGLTTASALAYVPLALAFTPWNWSEHTTFAFQLSRPLHYAVYYLAGLGIGAYGLQRGLLAPEGMLARRWAVWLGVALAALFLWMGLTGLAMRFGSAAPLVLQVAVGISFAVACAGGCFFMIAVCLRFGTVRSRICDSLANNSFGMYLFHYIFVVWLQYALLGMAWSAVAKASVVFGGTVLLAWTTTMAMRHLPFGAVIIGSERRMFATPPSPPGKSAPMSRYEGARQGLQPPNVVR